MVAELVSPAVSAPQTGGRRTKVLHLATRFVHGGSERDLADAIHSLPPEQYESCLLVGGAHNPALFEAMLPAGCRIVVEPRLQREVQPYRDLQAFLGIRRFIQANRFDVVHTCQSKAGVIGRLAARAAGTPVILHNLSMANFFEHQGRKSQVYRAAERLAGRWTDAYCVVGRDLTRRYQDARIASPDRYHVIRSALDLQGCEEAAALNRYEARRDYGASPDEAVVCYVGSLEERKGVLLLPAFLERLQALAEQPVRLLIAGEGPLEPVMCAAFETKGLSGQVSFLGFVADAPRVIAASDCLALLSEAEGLPQVLVQAIAVGRPFVAYPVDGVSELLQLGATGAVATNPGDAAAHALHYLVPLETPLIDLTEWSREHVRLAYRQVFDSATRHLPAAAGRTQ